MNNVSRADEENCLIGYGEISISECYDVVKDEQERRVPRLKHTRPRSQHQPQATRTDSVHVSTRDPNGIGRGESPLTEGVGQSEPEYFKHIFKATSADRPAQPETDFRTFFEKLRNPPEMKRKRTMLLRNSPASEAVDARPRLN